MKKLFLIMLILMSMFTTQLNASPGDLYPNWDWVIDHWVWVGSGDPTDPPPSPPRN